jgi:catechol 2,3-dioxygenase-like lactoylglutathione lyase family enzyme
MFTHIMIGSNNLEQARSFYDATFAALGGPTVGRGCRLAIDRLRDHQPPALVGVDQPASGIHERQRFDSTLIHDLLVWPIPGESDYVHSHHDRQQQLGAGPELLRCYILAYAYV